MSRWELNDFHGYSDEAARLRERDRRHAAEAEARMTPEGRDARRNAGEHINAAFQKIQEITGLSASMVVYGHVNAWLTPATLAEIPFTPDEWYFGCRVDVDEFAKEYERGMKTVLRELDGVLYFWNQISRKWVFMEGRNTYGFPAGAWPASPATAALLEQLPDQQLLIRGC